MMSDVQLNRDGFEIVSGVLNEEQQAELRLALGNNACPGRRGILSVPLVAELANAPEVLGMMSECLEAPARPVRAIYFDKSPEANWLVPWHQDLTIAVNTRTDVPGFGPWSVKDGIPHVQPPVALLEQMLTIRFHLDDCDESNGALHVIPGTHCFGRLDAANIRLIRETQPVQVCCLRAGDALLMRPLLLHASSHSTSDRHRRVLHIEYAACALPEPLHWHEAA